MVGSRCLGRVALVLSRFLSLFLLVGQGWLTLVGGYTGRTVYSQPGAIGRDLDVRKDIRPAR